MGNWNLGGVELEEYISRTCSNELKKNEEYNLLTEKCISMFREIVNKLDDDKDIMFDYEETISRMDEIIELTCFKIGARALSA